MVNWAIFIPYLIFVYIVLFIIIHMANSQRIRDEQEKALKESNNTNTNKIGGNSL